MAHSEALPLQWREVLGYAADLPPVDVSQGWPAGVLNFARASLSAWGNKPTSLHAAPQRQMIIVLEGAARIETGDGAFTVSPGDAYLLEDTTGSGHGATLIGSVDYLVAVVTLPK
jgi:hypothetical protein